MSRIGRWWSSLEKGIQVTLIVGIIGALIGLISAVAAVAGPVWAAYISKPSAPPAPSPDPSTTSTTSATPDQPVSCPPAGEAGAKQAHVSYLARNSILADPVYYTAKAETQQVFLGFGGRFKHSVPPGEKFLLLWAADRTTRDSSNKPGDGVYRKLQNYSTTEDCWWREGNDPMPNGDTKGLTYRFQLILVNDTHLYMFEDPTRTGFDENRLNSPGITRLAYFEIPTKDL